MEFSCFATTSARWLLLITLTIIAMIGGVKIGCIPHLTSTWCFSAFVPTSPIQHKFQAYVNEQSHFVQARMPRLIVPLNDCTDSPYIFQAYIGHHDYFEINSSKDHNWFPDIPTKPKYCITGREVVSYQVRTLRTVWVSVSQTGVSAIYRFTDYPCTVMSCELHLRGVCSLHLFVLLAHSNVARPFLHSHSFLDSPGIPQLTAPTDLPPYFCIWAMWRKVVGQWGY